MNQGDRERGTSAGGYVRLFDAQSGFGGPEGGKEEAVGVDEYVDEMSRLGIARALVRTAPNDLIVDTCAANNELYGACEEHRELTPCPMLVPNTAYDRAPDEEQIADAIARGSGAAVLRPKLDRWDLAAWCGGPLLAGLAERRLPVFCSIKEFSFGDLADLARRYPDMPLIAAELQYLQQRTLVPLLETFPNVYASLGSNYVVYGGIALLVDKVGPERLLFGTGFPAAEPMGAATMLMYAPVSDDAKALIGSANLERLLEGIER